MLSYLVSFFCQNQICVYWIVLFGSLRSSVIVPFVRISLFYNLTMLGNFRNWLYNIQRYAGKCIQKIITQSFIQANCYLIVSNEFFLHKMHIYIDSYRCDIYGNTACTKSQQFHRSTRLYNELVFSNNKMSLHSKTSDCP